MKQPEIADLHGALSLIGYEIAQGEVTNHRFGNSTQAAILQFQAAQGLPGTGIVDEATASKMNGILIDRGVLEGGQPGSGNGRVTLRLHPLIHLKQTSFLSSKAKYQVDGTPSQRYLVRAFDRSFASWQEINEAQALTDNTGRYRSLTICEVDQKMLISK
jgi:peptidoglycan hydrolase-like protein with peptidoglycan-binding domain